MAWKPTLLSLAGLLSSVSIVPAQNPAPMTTAGNPVVVAVVNGENISLAEVDAVLKQRPPSLVPLTLGQQRQMRLEVVGAMIDDLLLKQFLRQKNIAVEPAEVEKHIEALKAAQQARMKTLADYLRETNQTEEQLRIGVASMLQMTKYLNATVNEAELRRYYETNKDYFDKVTVRASHIVLRVSPTATPSERENAKRKLTALRAEILAGKIDFAEAAKKNSMCTSAPAGGDLGHFTRKWMTDEPFAEAAFAAKVNEVTDVVETEFGVHLIKVTERSQPTPSTYEQCVEDVKDCYIEEMRQNLLSQLRKSARITIHLP